MPDEGEREEEGAGKVAKVNSKSYLVKLPTTGGSGQTPTREFRLKPTDRQPSSGPSSRNLVFHLPITYYCQPSNRQTSPLQLVGRRSFKNDRICEVERVMHVHLPHICRQVP